MEIQPTDNPFMVVAHSAGGIEPLTFASRGFKFFSRTGRKVMREAAQASQEHRTAHFELPAEELSQARDRLYNRTLNLRPRRDFYESSQSQPRQEFLLLNRIIADIDKFESVHPLEPVNPEN